MSEETDDNSRFSIGIGNMTVAVALVTVIVAAVVNRRFRSTATETDAEVETETDAEVETETDADTETNE